MASSHSDARDLGTIERALQLMKCMATAGKRGLALTQLASATALPHSTVHRLLHRLIAERMAVQSESTKRYMLGPLAFELGIAASMMFDLREPCRKFLSELAEEVGDTIYLTIRSGVDAVCLDRYEGPSPIRVLTLNVGSRRPLGFGAGGLAMLAFMPVQEREELIVSLASKAPADGYLPETDLRAAVTACRQRGYSLIRNRINLGVTAVGVPLFDSLDQPYAAISVAAIGERMSPARIASLALNLQNRAKAIRQVLGTSGQAGNVAARYS